MSEALNIDTKIPFISALIDNLKNGIIQVPNFQRDFVWDRDDIKDLFISIEKSHPIGSILLWQPNERIGENQKKIGSYYISDKGKAPFYILDGFQRLSSLFGCLINQRRERLERDEIEWEEYFNIHYDLESQTFFYPRSNVSTKPFQIPLYILFDSREFRVYSREEFEKMKNEVKIDEYLERADKLSYKLLNYQIPSINIQYASMTDAVEIFTKINRKGKIISFDWMINALSIGDDFRFGDVIDKLVDKLKDFNFDTIERNILFRCIQSSFGKLYFDNTDINKLAKQKNFREVTINTIPQIIKAVRFLFEELLVLDAKLLPYGIQLIFIMDFFKKFENPTFEQKEKLKNWFWITTYSNYFTNFSLSNQRRAYQQFQLFLKDEVDDPVYNDALQSNDIHGRKFIASKIPNNLSMRSVRSKALILFMLNYANEFKPVDYDKIDGYDMNKLFSPSDKAENYIPLIKLLTTNGLYELTQTTYLNSATNKHTDMSFWLSDNDMSRYSRFFIDEEVKQHFIREDHEKALAHRKMLIKNAEKAFVEALNMEYESEKKPT